MASHSVLATESRPLISISTVSHGDLQPLVAMLESIAAHEPIGRLQLIVTDNLGSDLPDLAPSGWHSILLLRAKQPRGFAMNHNAAFEAAAGEYFCILNPDVEFTQSVFEQLLGHLESGRGHMAAPALVDSSGALQDSFRALPTPWEIVRRRIGMAAPVPPVDADSLLFPDWIAGMFMLMHRATFSLLGGFDSGYRLYFEDVELCTRLRLAGMRVVVDPSVRIRHDPRRRSRGPGRHLIWHARSAIRFFRSDTYRRARRLDQDA